MDRQWVLTAAACFAVDPANPTQVTAGKPALKTTATIGRSSLTGTGGHAAEVVELVPSPSRDLVMARLVTPTPSGIAPIELAASPAGEGDTLQAIGYGRTKTEWVPGTAHTASMKVGLLSDTEVTLAGATANDALCKGDTGAPLLQESEEGVALVGIATRSRQGGCLGETETRTDAVATRTDDMADWIATTAGRSWALLMTATDFNGDKKADLLAIDAADDFLYAQPGDGKGKFGKRVKVNEGRWTGMRILAVTDFTGDGKADILAAHTNGNLYLYPGNGKNGITGSSVVGSGWGGIRLIAAADFNGTRRATWGPSTPTATSSSIRAMARTSPRGRCPAPAGPTCACSPPETSPETTRPTSTPSTTAETCTCTPARATAPSTRPGRPAPAGRTCDCSPKPTSTLTRRAI
ncbi:FG-GAP-like repeat-containing protein [Streptomyces sp. NPDC087659]|uniref:FG-GAP-like repeat-containing protein n=1 Tax=Streptomyces sp. NPDC087659 TaxID=3365801 RepID=UPI0038000ADF